MKTLKSWTMLRRTETGVELEIEGRHLMRVAVLEDALFRVSLLKDGAWRLNRSWSVAPDGHMPWEGRSRDELGGFALPGFELTEGDSLSIATETMRLTIDRPLTLRWEARIDGTWRRFAEERPSGGTMLGLRDYAVSHFLRRQPGELVFGLGEKAGRLERSGRRYEMRNLDAMGYDAESTDPLYKHIPFTMTRTAGAGCWSIFYDNLAGAWFDLGNEMDNYHLPYRSYRAEDGDLDYYMAWAPELLDLVKGQARLTGGTAFPPRWSLGYSGSTMSYTDAPDAQAQLLGFLDRIAAHDLPCDSFQMSSGYSSIGHRRYVFHWNHDKVPDPAGMAARFAEAGVNLVANIKPCLLDDHPMYDDAAARGLFIRDSDSDGPERSSFWDGEGSHLDFTNPDTVAWWKAQVTEKLLENGIGSTWNDNNEYEVWDRAARCAGFGSAIDIALIRPLQSLLMSRASEEAQREHAPGRRPYLICRSGAPGLQRHAQTWTGDNRTSWETLRWNIRMGLGLSLSGFFNIGHDVGGFAGPRPEPELFLRWVQNGIFHPRFTIHSWNDDGTVNEPWMYPEVTPHIRAAMALRYRLMPYLYTLLWQAVTDHEPMLRPTLLDHPQDARCAEDTNDFMLGRDLLVANVVEPGAAARRVYLPENGVGWWDFWSGTWHAGGGMVTLPVTLGSMPLFVRAGAVLPLARAAMRAAPEAETGRDLMVFPPKGAGTGRGMLYEDDGVSENGPYSLMRFDLAAEGDRIGLKIRREGTGDPRFDCARIILPGQEARPLSLNGRAVGPSQEVPL